MAAIFRAILDEIGAPLSRVDLGQMQALCVAIAKARRVVVYGCGREALQIRGFAMRLYHLGVNVSVVGEMNCPPVEKGDLLVATSGPGELATVLALMKQASKAGGTCAVITAEADGGAAKLADKVLVVPAQTMATDQGPNTKSVLPMGSAFEGALFVLFEVMVARLTEMLGVTHEAMRSRHTNLE
ncbi:MAG: SIS domain-containing protein [Rhizobiaceae bacterium]